MFRWTRDFAWALVSGLIVLVFTLAVTKNVFRAAVTALIVAVVIAIMLSVLTYFKDKSKPEEEDPGPPAAFRIRDSSDITIIRSTALGMPFLDAHRVERLALEDNQAVDLPSDEDKPPE